MKKKQQTKNQPISVKWLTQSAAIAALYVLLTFLSSAVGLSNGPIQLRLSEALTILPVFMPAAIPGLCAGCLMANILTGCALWDIVLGTLSTLIGALGTYYLRRQKFGKYLPPILINTLILPFVFSYVYAFEGSLIYFGCTVFIGEFLSCGVCGVLLYRTLNRYRKHLPFL